MHIGIIKEGKTPADKRVPFTPSQLKQLCKAYPSLRFSVQSSPVRCYSDADYRAAHVPVIDDMADCDVLFGIKEVPVADLLPHKTYFFFSHTAKRQAHNQVLLQAALTQGIRLVDYEYLLDDAKRRVVAFGHYAGLVGAHHALWAYGLRSSAYALPRAQDCVDYEAMCSTYASVKFPAIKIVVTGSGRVAQGVAELLTRARIPEVSPEEFLRQSYPHAVFVQLAAFFYHCHRSKEESDQAEFYAHPERYRSVFLPYAQAADVLIAGAYWPPQGDVLFSRTQAADKSFRIRLISDITCDVNGSIPATQRTSTLDDPLYEYDPHTDKLHPFGTSSEHIAVMAVDYLPCALPRDASYDFGKQLMTHVIPQLVDQPDSPMLQGATITEAHQLGGHFHYLSDWVKTPSRTK